MDARDRITYTFFYSYSPDLRDVFLCMIADGFISADKYNRYSQLVGIIAVLHKFPDILFAVYPHMIKFRIATGMGKGFLSEPASE